MRILVDLDGVLANWGKQYDADLDELGHTYDAYLSNNDNPAEVLYDHDCSCLIPRTADQQAFNLKEGMTDAQQKVIDQIMDRPGFYADLEPFERAVAAVKELDASDNEVFIVTSPWLTNPTCIQDKFEWVNKHFGDDWVDRVIITKDKTLVHGDILIDDKPEVKGAHVPSWEHIVFDQPYNKMVTDKKRIFNWSVGAIEDFRDVIESAKVQGKLKLLPERGSVFESEKDSAKIRSKLKLSPGEYRIPPEVVQKYGKDFLDKINENIGVKPTDETRTTSATGGQKGKKLAEVGSLDPQSLLRVAEVAGFGSQKYDRLNYMKGYDWSLNFDAMQRHLLLFWSGQDKDDESGMLHLAHAAWHCLTLMSFLERGLGTDDRYTSMEISQLQKRDPVNK